MSTMKALVKRGGTVELSDVPIPAISGDEVLVQVAAAGLCRTDVQVGRGTIPAADPVILGHEFAGRVVEVGWNVWTVKTGQRVAVRPVFGCGTCPVCKGGDEINCPERTMLGVEHDGAFAEYVRVPAGCVVPVPEHLSWQAAAYAEPVAAALAVLEAGIPPSAHVFVFGHNRFAQLVERLLRGAGVHDVIVWPFSEAAELEDVADVVVETELHPGTLASMARTARPGGLLILKSRQPVTLSLDPLPLLRKRLTIRAVNYGSFEKAVGILAEGRLNLEGLLGPAYPLERFVDVFAYAEASETAKLFFDPTGEHVRHRR